MCWIKFLKSAGLVLQTCSGHQLVTVYIADNDEQYVGEASSMTVSCQRLTAICLTCSFMVLSSTSVASSVSKKYKNEEEVREKEASIEVCIFFIFLSSWLPTESTDASTKYSVNRCIQHRRCHSYPF